MLRQVDLQLAYTYTDRARISDFRYGGVSVGSQQARQCTKPVTLISASVSFPLPLPKEKNGGSWAKNKMQSFSLAHAASKWPFILGWLATEATAGMSLTYRMLKNRSCLIVSWSSSKPIFLPSVLALSVAMGNQLFISLLSLHAASWLFLWV